MIQNDVSESFLLTDLNSNSGYVFWSCGDVTDMMDSFCQVENFYTLSHRCQNFFDDFNQI